MADRPTVDFKALKAITLEQAISFLDLVLYKKEGEELRLRCPICSGDKEGSTHNRGLAIHPDKGFTCHISGKKGTDAVALVAHVRGISQYDAGAMLQAHFLKGDVPRETTDVLKPLDYLETSHPVADMLGLTPATLEALGGGYAPRGTMAERLLIPLRLPDGTLVGYAAIATKIDQEVLKFPANLEAMCSKKPEASKKSAGPDELRKLFRLVS